MKTMRYLNGLAVATLLCLGVACQTGRYSTSGFRLPPDGNAERGKLAFVSHQCQNCHTVDGVALPETGKEQQPRIPLGGTVMATVSDGYLFSAIANPSYRLASNPQQRAAVAKHGPMPPCVDQMTIRELTDIVEFLQAHYQVREPSRQAYY